MSTRTGYEHPSDRAHDLGSEKKQQEEEGQDSKDPDPCEYGEIATAILRSYRTRAGKLPVFFGGVPALVSSPESCSEPEMRADAIHGRLPRCFSRCKNAQAWIFPLKHKSGRGGRYLLGKSLRLKDGSRGKQGR